MVPELSGKVIVLSFVGSVTVNRVSLESSVIPSKTICLLSKEIPSRPPAEPTDTCSAATSPYSSEKLSFILVAPVRRSSPVPSLPSTPISTSLLAIFYSII